MCLFRLAFKMCCHWPFTLRSHGECNSHCLSNGGTQGQWLSVTLRVQADLLFYLRIVGHNTSSGALSISTLVKWHLDNSMSAWGQGQLTQSVASLSWKKKTPLKVTISHFRTWFDLKANSSPIIKSTYENVFCMLPEVMLDTHYWFLSNLRYPVSGITLIWNLMST